MKGKTLFIYLCGSNLESRQGSAGKNIDEMLKADIDEDLHVVIETGGASKWRRHNISSDAIQRYEIKNHELCLLEELPQANMGDAKTLSDFLSWGQENYPTEDQYFFFWDHGGGSAKGVCFDENYGFDSLTLPEIQNAFASANLREKFEIVGFDACLMGSLETGVILQDYASFLLASEEVVPGGGWDYQAILETLSKEEDPVILGKAFCDSFLAKCQRSKAEDSSTLSFAKLAKAKKMVRVLDEFGEYLNRVARQENFFSTVKFAASHCERFGESDIFSGSSNMVDLYSFMLQVLLWADPSWGYSELQEYILYSVSNGERANSGTSFFYPISINESEIENYISLGVSEPYNRYLSSYFLHAPKETVTFLDKGSVDENGDFSITLTPDSSKYLSSINYLLLEEKEDGKMHLLFSDNRYESNWEEMHFKSNFTGDRRAYAGHPLYSSLLNDRGPSYDFRAPIKLNGEEAYFRYYVWSDDGSTTVAGTTEMNKEEWQKEVALRKIAPGDTMEMVEDYTIEDGTLTPNYGESFVIETGEEKMSLLPLEGKEYRYVFYATDIFGRLYFSDMATFKMKEGMPQEGEPIATITKIEPFSYIFQIP